MARAFDAAKTRVYTTVKLGPNREKTPAGFLLCRNVAIARTGEQVYGRNSTPIEVGPDGFAVVSRDPEEVFRPETIASFNGAPIVNDHPPGDVLPENWKRLAKGTVLHPRRGEGDESDLLLADLLIYDAEMIQLIDDGKDEVSCGYDADYVQTAPGRGKQVDIVGNHLAIVEAGRCGSRCAIRDHAEPGEGAKRVAHKTQTKAQRIVDSIKSSLQKKFRDAVSEEELKKAIDESEEVKEAVRDAEEGEGGETHVHVNLEGEKAGVSKEDHEALKSRVQDCEDRLAKMEAGKTSDAKGKDGEGKEKLEDDDKDSDAKVTDADEEEFEKEAKEGTKDARKVRDSASFDESFQETVAMAEIIAPGIKIPTFDSAAKPKATLNAMCSLRRKALRMANETTDGSAVITAQRRGKQLTHDALEQLTCSQTRDLFYAVGTTIKLANGAAQKARQTSATRDNNDIQPVKGGLAVSPAEWNKRAEKFWDTQSGK